MHNQEVSKIITSNKKASGVKLKNGKELRADIVIANADYNFVETKLLDQEHRTYKKEYWDKKTVSPSGLLIYMGVKKRVPNLRHHNLFFDTNWDQHFDNVFNAKKWSENPLFYLCAPTKTDASVAPKSCENIFVLAPQAAGKQPSKKTIEKTVQNIIKRIEQKVGQDFSGDIEVLDVRAQDYFTQTFNALDGNAFGLSHTMLQSGPLRPKMQSKKVKNLYYVGQYTNPGTGVPLVVLSGKTVAKLVSKNEK